jgi:hypothetical protein
MGWQAESFKHDVYSQTEKNALPEPTYWKLFFELLTPVAPRALLAPTATCEHSTCYIAQREILRWPHLMTGALQVIIWGVGTALGELPPYLVAYSHRMAGEVDEDYEVSYRAPRARMHALQLHALDSSRALHAAPAACLYTA